MLLKRVLYGFRVRAWYKRQVHSQHTLKLSGNVVGQVNWSTFFYASEKIEGQYPSLWGDLIVTIDDE